VEQVVRAKPLIACVVRLQGSQKFIVTVLAVIEIVLNVLTSLVVFKICAPQLDWACPHEGIEPINVWPHPASFAELDEVTLIFTCVPL
jgi:hypothetical protein